MDSRREAGTTELTDLISIWSNAWAKEKGARSIVWVEHTKADVDARLKGKWVGIQKLSNTG